MATSTTVIPAHLPNKRKRRRTNRKKISIKKANNKLKIDSDCYENDDILALYLRERTKRYNMKENNDKTEEEELNFWKLDCDKLDDIYDPASQVAYGTVTVDTSINSVVIEEGSTTSDRGIDETNNNNNNQSQQNNNNNEEEEKEDQQGNDTNKKRNKTVTSTKMKTKTIVIQKKRKKTLTLMEMIKSKIKWKERKKILILMEMIKSKITL